ncbi:MAG: hypothetical protein M5U28_06620 [Sandaracinaceae bacterium]|nr:hypothetical protein [Sandaracinaceae bacterium]
MPKRSGDVGDLEDLLLVVDDLLPVATLLVDTDHRLERRPVVRVLLERLVEHVERLAAITLLALDDTELVEDVRDLVATERVAVVDEEHLVVLERLLPVLGAVVGLGQLEQRRQVLLVDLVGLAEGLDGRLVLLEPQRHVAEHERQPVLLARVALARSLHEHVEQRVGVLPALRLDVLIRERERRVLVVRVLLLRRLPALNRAAVLVEALLEQPAELDEQLRDPARLLVVLRLLLEGLGRRQPVAGVEVDLPHGLERGQVPRLDVEGLAVVVDRGVAIGEVLVEDAAHPVPQIDLLLRILREPRQLAHHVERLAVVPALLVEARERVERAHVVFVDRQDVEVGVDGPIGVVDLDGVDVADGRVALDLLRAVRGRRDVALVGLDEPVPALQVAVEPLEAAQRGLVARIDLEHLLEALGGALGLDELLLEHRAEAAEDADPLLVRGDEVVLALEDAEEIAPVLALRVQPLEALERAKLRRVGLEDAGVLLDGVVDALEPQLVDLRDREPRLEHVLGARERRDLQLEDLEQLRPIGARLVQALERADRGEVGRIGLDGLPVVGRGLLGQPEVLLAELAHLGEHRRALLAAADDLRHPAEHLREHLPLTEVPVEIRLRLHRRVVRRIEREDLVVVRDRVLGVTELLAVPLRAAQAERDLHGALVRPVLARELLQGLVGEVQRLVQSPASAATRSSSFAVCAFVKSCCQASMSAARACGRSLRCFSFVSATRR